MGSFENAITRFSESATLKRSAAGSYGTEGTWTPGAVTSSTFTGSFQPASQRDMQMLPEGRREKATLKVYTTTELKDASASGKTQTDRVTYRGEEYEVVAVQRWFLTQNYYRAMLQRLGDG